MFAEELRRAVEVAPRGALPEVAALLWRAFGAGQVSEAEAEALSALIEGRTVIPAAPVPPRRPASSRPRSDAPPGRPSIFPPKRHQRSPDRARSLERRRTLAASGPMPPALAARHTTGELAALRIIADEVRARGACELCVSAIAARAGVSASTARNAIRTAARSGLLHVEERRLLGRRNDPNRITIVDAAWRAWIAKGGRTGGGAFKKLEPTDRGSQKAQSWSGQRPAETSQRAAGRQGRARARPPSDSGPGPSRRVPSMR